MFFCAKARVCVCIDFDWWRAGNGNTKTSLSAPGEREGERMRETGDIKRDMGREKGRGSQMEDIIQNIDA